MTDATNHDQLVRLEGEQALLKHNNETLIAAQQRDQLALRNLVNNISTGTDWHPLSLELLNRIKARETQTALNYQRLAELSRLTGIR